MKEKRMDGAIRRAVLKRDNYTCRYCGSKQEPFHADHVYPYVKGGETSFDNLVTACVGCNQHKHDTVGMWPKPIGYFDDKERHSPFITVVTLLGVVMTMSGGLMLKNGNVLVGDVVFLLGTVVAFLSITFNLTRS